MKKTNVLAVGAFVLAAALCAFGIRADEVADGRDEIDIPREVVSRFDVHVVESTPGLVFRLDAETSTFSFDGDMTGRTGYVTFDGFDLGDTTFVLTVEGSAGCRFRDGKMFKFEVNGTAVRAIEKDKRAAADWDFVTGGDQAVRLTALAPVERVTLAFYDCLLKDLKVRVAVSSQIDELPEDIVAVDAGAAPGLEEILPFASDMPRGFEGAELEAINLSDADKFGRVKLEPIDNAGNVALVNGSFKNTAAGLTVKFPEGTADRRYIIELDGLENSGLAGGGYFKLDINGRVAVPDGYCDENGKGTGREKKEFTAETFIGVEGGAIAYTVRGEVREICLVFWNSELRNVKVRVFAERLEPAPVAEDSDAAPVSAQID